MKDSGIVIHELHCEINALKKEIEDLKIHNNSLRSKDFYSALKEFGGDVVKVDSVVVPVGGKTLTMRRYANLKSSEF